MKRKSKFLIESLLEGSVGDLSAVTRLYCATF